MEDVVVSFTRWACPDMSSSIPSVIRQKKVHVGSDDSYLSLLSSLPQDGATTKLADVARWTIIIALQDFNSSVHSIFTHAIALPSFTIFFFLI